MEDKKDFYVEQPETFQDQGEVSQNCVLDIDETKGSTLGKFKDEKSLLEAYNNLQSEFTKKCQALSKLQNEDNRKLPLFMEEDWDNRVKSFLENNPQAKEFSDCISKKILSDREIVMSENPLQLAWESVMKENFKSPKKLMEDPEFIEEYVLKNTEIKKKIIDEYFKGLNVSTSPIVMTGVGGGSVLTPPNRPKTLKDANRIATEMLK